MIKLSNITKRFGSVCAINDVSFLIRKQEIVGLLGPNGAGKTTTMRLITGYLSADSGSIDIDGVAVSENPSAKEKIGYLPENTPLYQELEVTELIKYFCKLRSIDKKYLNLRINDVVEECGLGSVRFRPVSELSKGFKQRVGLALALVHRPSILILDEPTSGLDPNQIDEIRNLIKELGKERTIILSTHIMQEVEAVCSRALVIDKGKLVGDGTLNELKKQTEGGAVFEIAMKSPRSIIEDALLELKGFRISDWLSVDSDKISRFNLTILDSSMDAETIFRWASKSNLPLLELKTKSLSLEDVFRDLTSKEDL